MPDTPHILILMPDQQRADAMSCAGNAAIQTPNMDRLAAEGVRFRHGITSSAICMPARASFISGTFPHQHGVWRNSGSLPQDSDTFFQHLQAAGYRTAHIGKSHYGGHDGPHLRYAEPYMHARGFRDVHEVTGPRATRNCNSYLTDHWRSVGLLDTFYEDYNSRDVDWAFTVKPSALPWEEHMDSYTGRRAVEWVDAAPSDGPTCMYVGFPGPHEPWDAPEPYASMYDPADMPAPISSRTDQEWLSGDVRDVMDARRHDDATAEQYAAIRANYYGKVSLIDHWFGEILDAYERRGWLDDTLVIHFSDHGEMAGDHDMIYKSVPYYGSMGVPFTVRWPGHVVEGAVSDALVQQTDIFPTIDEIIGHETPRHVAGRSLWPVLRDPDARVHDAAFMEIGDGTGRTVTAQTADWKYTLAYDGSGLYLFDLGGDSDECVNLVGHPDYAAVEAGMRDTILRWMVRTQDVER